MSTLFYPCRSLKDRPKRKKAGSAVGDIVGGVIKELRNTSRITAEDIAGAWLDVVGKPASRHSQPVSFRKNTLFINIDRSTWLYELTLRKREIIAGLGEKLQGKKIKNIRFRIGDIAAERGGKQKNERGL